MELPPPSLVVIGNFDGVHRGHRAVLGDALERAKRASLASRVLTFAPHPAEVLGHGAPSTLTRLPTKIRLLGEAGFSTVVQRFDMAFASLSPEAFARELLRGQLDARVVVVGRNFRFGHRRAGDLEALVALGRQLGFEVHPHELEGDARGPWSSTRVRASIARGDLDDATSVLGRPHVLEGVVVHGQHRARTLGFPTANLSDVCEALPSNGVYAVRVERVARSSEIDEQVETLGGGVANIGVRPTVEAGFAVEVHVFDLEGERADLYDTTLRIHLMGRLRDEQRFVGLEALKAQIALDVVRAHSVLDA